MGAVQKLATVVIIGLVALATVLTVYIAREPERRDSELTEQEQLSIVRGTDLYIQYCLQCHGPAGTGRDEPETDRIGAPLNQDAPGVETANTAVDYQSDDPAAEQLAEDWIRFRINFGVPAEPISTSDVIMPAFGNELNGEEISDLVFMIMNVDWDYVYNQAVHTTGETVAQAECAATPVPGGTLDLPEYCDHIEEAPPLYPTAPPQEEEEGIEPSDEDGEEQPAGDVAAELEARDPYEWSQSEVTVAPGDTIQVTNVGSLQHDFTVEALGISQNLPNGEPVMITIPEDVEPGEYEFICSVPGHAAGGMVGTLIIEG